MRDNYDRDDIRFCSMIYPTCTQVFPEFTDISIRTLLRTEQIEIFFEGVSRTLLNSALSPTQHGRPSSAKNIVFSASCSERVPTAMHDDVTATSRCYIETGITPIILSITNAKALIGSR